MICLGPGSIIWYWVLNEEVETLHNDENNIADAWKQCSEEEIVKPVEDIDKEECHGENGTSVTIDVVWIFHCKDRCCLAWCVLHRRQAAALCWNILFWFSTAPSVTVCCLLRGVLCSWSNFQRLVWLGGGDDRDGAISIGFIELPQKVLIDTWIATLWLRNTSDCLHTWRTVLSPFVNPPQSGAAWCRSGHRHTPVVRRRWRWSRFLNRHLWPW